MNNDQDTAYPTPAQNAQLAQPAPQSPQADATTVKLDVPLKRGNGNDIKEVLVSKPTAGALRGLSLAQLLQMDAVSLQTLLPRITQPQITKPDTALLDPADLVALGTAVVGFLVPKSQRADFLSE